MTSLSNIRSLRATFSACWPASVGRNRPGSGRNAWVCQNGSSQTGCNCLLKIQAEAVARATKAETPEFPVASQDSVSTYPQLPKIVLSSRRCITSKIPTKFQCRITDRCPKNSIPKNTFSPAFLWLIISVRGVRFSFGLANGDSAHVPPVVFNQSHSFSRPEYHSLGD